MIELLLGIAGLLAYPMMFVCVRTINNIQLLCRKFLVFLHASCLFNSFLLRMMLLKRSAIIVHTAANQGNPRRRCSGDQEDKACFKFLSLYACCLFHRLSCTVRPTSSLALTHRLPCLATRFVLSLVLPRPSISLPDVCPVPSYLSLLLCAPTRLSLFQSRPIPSRLAHRSPRFAPSRLQLVLPRPALPLSSHFYPPRAPFKPWAAPTYPPTAHPDPSLPFCCSIALRRRCVRSFNPSDGLPWC